ncbi:C-C motif chemokine 22 isoform X2 [Colius striatus]|uniref:C-C motif chemokine 22 isoform X2 n=1 Tax=Colius striatus TaxID=57412 RepID=UPI002B1E0FC2|nr:C-C motif chemokine 22 isoform X2 [Colius striatus]
MTRSSPQLLSHATSHREKGEKLPGIQPFPPPRHEASFSAGPGRAEAPVPGHSGWRFLTLKLYEICADPEAPWVKKIVEKLDQKKAPARPAPPGTTPAAAPQEPGAFQKHVGLTAPPPATASTSLFQGAATTVLERTHIGAARTEAAPPEAATEHTAKATAQAPATTSASPVAVSAASHHPVLPTNEPPDPKQVRINVPDGASSSLGSDLPSILDVPKVPAHTPLVSTLAATHKGSSDHTNRAATSPAGALATGTSAYSSPAGKQEPPGTSVLPGQARAELGTDSPEHPPPPSFLAASQMHFVIPASVVGALMLCIVAAVWLYLRFGVKAEEMSRDMVQGLLYHKEGPQNDIYPMKVI